MERKVAGSSLMGVIAILQTALKLNFSCAYSCLMCSHESVICMVFSLQKCRPRANKKKVFMPQKSPTSEIRTLVHQARLSAADLLLPQIHSCKIAEPIRNDQQTFLLLRFCFQDSMRPGSRGFFETGRVYEIFGPAGKTVFL